MRDPSTDGTVQMENFLAYTQGKLKSKGYAKKLENLLGLHSVHVTFIRNEMEVKLSEEEIVGKISELFSRINVPVTKVSERWTNERGLSTPASLIKTAESQP